MKGPLADHQICDLTQGPNASIRIRSDCIQPSSTDLPIGQVIYHVASEPTLDENFSICDFLKDHTFNKFELNKLYGKILTITPGSTYIVEIDAELDLPSHVFACANPKSSSGRNGLHTKLICEHGTEYDFVPKGYKGRIYVCVSPRVFPVQLRAGESLVQARYFSHDRAFEADFHLEHLHRQDRLIGNLETEPDFTPEGMLLHLSLKGIPGNLVANKVGRPIPIWEKGTLDPRAYFREKPLYQERLFLEPGEFCLAKTVELIRIPPNYCAEMIPYTANRGELRWHDAGFIDPAFGYGRNGEINGSTIVLEITNFGAAPVQLSDGQAIGVIRLERLCAEPRTLYGDVMTGGVRSHYQGQIDIRTSKNFQDWKSYLG